MITKDSNVICVALAGNIVTGLAKGLRKGFQNYASFVSEHLKNESYVKCIYNHMCVIL